MRQRWWTCHCFGCFLWSRRQSDLVREEMWVLCRFWYGSSQGLVCETQLLVIPVHWSRVGPGRPHRLLEIVQLDEDSSFHFPREFWSSVWRGVPESTLGRPRLPHARGVHTRQHLSRLWRHHEEVPWILQQFDTFPSKKHVYRWPHQSLVALPPIIDLARSWFLEIGWTRYRSWKACLWYTLQSHNCQYWVPRKSINTWACPVLRSTILWQPFIQRERLVRWHVSQVNPHQCIHKNWIQQAILKTSDSRGN